MSSTVIRSKFMGSCFAESASKGMKKAPIQENR